MVADQLREAIAHPLSRLAAVVSVLGQFGFGWFDPLWTLLSSTANLWFPAIAVSAGEVFPRIGLGDWSGPVLFGAAIVFVAVQLDRLSERAMAFLNDRL
jgi:hypothetical protein